MEEEGGVRVDLVLSGLFPAEVEVDGLVPVDLLLSGGLFDLGRSSSPLGGDRSLSLSSFLP